MQHAITALSFACLAASTFPAAATEARRVELDHIGAYNWKVEIENISVGQFSINTGNKRPEVNLDALLETADISSAIGPVAVDNPIFEAQTAVQENVLAAEPRSAIDQNNIREFNFLIEPPTVAASGSDIIREIVLSEAAVVLADGTTLTATGPIIAQQFLDPNATDDLTAIGTRLDFNFTQPMSFENPDDNRTGFLDGTFSLAVVPAPGALALVGTVGLGVAQRRRR